MRADLALWSGRRWLVAAAVAGVSVGGLILAASMLSNTPGQSAQWWAFPAVAVGGILLGLIAAGYIEAPIGAEATMCDLRWPVLGLVGLYVASDASALVPTLSAEVRPAVAVAALAVLVWALAERMRGERLALAADRRREAAATRAGDPFATAVAADHATDLAAGHAGDGETCSTCRPLFPTRTRSTGGDTP